jgi:hypothetical protein
MRDQHTPGPWCVKGAAILPEAPSFNWIGSVQASNMPEWEANARLIAAAPDLLEACQTLATLLDTDDWIATGRLAVKQAQAAIAKVRGAAADR